MLDVRVGRPAAPDAPASDASAGPAYPEPMTACVTTSLASAGPNVGGVGRTNAVRSGARLGRRYPAFQKEH